MSFIFVFRGFLFLGLSMALANGAFAITGADPLESRIQKCLSAEKCSLQEGLETLKEINTVSASSLDNIIMYCDEIGHEGCITPRKSEIELWKRHQQNALALMKRLEAGEIVSKQTIAESEMNR